MIVLIYIRQPRNSCINLQPGKCHIKQQPGKYHIKLEPGNGCINLYTKFMLNL